MVRADTLGIAHLRRRHVNVAAPDGCSESERHYATDAKDRSAGFRLIHRAFTNRCPMLWLLAYIDKS
jgi:hypothetical protein